MACEWLGYEVQSSSRNDEEGEEQEQEVWSGGQGESEEGSSEDEEIERQWRLAVTGKEMVNVVLPPLYVYTCTGICNIHVHNCRVYLGRNGVIYPSP